MNEADLRPVLAQEVGLPVVVARMGHDVQHCVRSCQRRHDSALMPGANEVDVHRWGRTAPVVGEARIDVLQHALDEVHADVEGRVQADVDQPDPPVLQVIAPGSMGQYRLAGPPAATVRACPPMQASRSRKAVQRTLVPGASCQRHRMFGAGGVGGGLPGSRNSTERVDNARVTATESAGEEGRDGAMAGLCPAPAEVTTVRSVLGTPAATKAGMRGCGVVIVQETTLRRREKSSACAEAGVDA